MRSEIAIRAATVVMALSIAPTNAHAFCRTVSDPLPPNFDPAAAGEGENCFASGVWVYQASQCFPYRLRAQESAVLPRTALSTALARAFGTWTATNATCSPGISAIELGPVTGARIVEYKQGERNNNVVGVVPAPWRYDGGTDTLALTTVTFSTITGEIYDSDLEIREDVRWSTAGTPPADAYDLESVLTHEVGHAFGLAHSGHVDAVMSPNYEPGSTSKRTLSADDGAGVCAIYPDRQTRVTGANGSVTGVVASTACDLAVAAPGETSPCGAEPVVGHGCAIGSTGSSRGAWLAGVAFLGALLARARRRGTKGHTLLE